jgi:hypothetical protein
MKILIHINILKSVSVLGEFPLDYFKNSPYSYNKF